MNEKFLTKIEVLIPIKPGIPRILAKIINTFICTNGIGGCTYLVPFQPAILKGKWVNKTTKEIVDDDVCWVYGCYDIGEAEIQVKDLVKYIKEIVEREAGEKLAWITYSSVCMLESC